MPEDKKPYSEDYDRFDNNYVEDKEKLDYHLPDEEIREVVDALHAQDADTVFAVLDDLSSADTAELLSKIKQEDREELLSKFGDALEAETFVELDTEISRASLSAMSAAQVAQLVSELESDDALLLIEQLDYHFQTEIMKKLSAKMRVALEEGLSFPEDSAGRLMSRDVVAIPEFWTVGKTIDYLRAAADNIPKISLTSSLLTRHTMSSEKYRSANS